MVQALLVLILPPLLTALWLAGWPAPPGAGRSAAGDVAVSQSLGGIPDAGFQRAYAPRPFRFPEDHGPHPGFRNEWWYFTGNLSGPGGRRFGYQLTLFRIALAPAATATDSAWRSHELYMGHLALSDVAGRRHHAYERFARAALGLAGAGVRPFRVWLEDWRAEGGDSADGLFPLRLRAAEGDIALDLTLEAGKPLVLQGELGLSRKSAEPGNASYYYSYTRLPTRGVVTVGDQRFPVSGASWLDREWSTSALGPEQEGWDWFALQLDDSRELMFYRLRRKDGTVDPHSSGVLVEADGRYRPLAADTVALRPLAYWTSPESGDRYPVRWRLALPAEDLELIVAARLPDQEMRLTVRYWEGAVSVEGRQRERVLRGQGYLEMTRYGRRAGGQPAKASTEPSRQP